MWMKIIFEKGNASCDFRWYYRKQSWWTTFFHRTMCVRCILEKSRKPQTIFFHPRDCSLFRVRRYSLCLRTFFCVNLRHFLPVLAHCCSLCLLQDMVEVTAICFNKRFIFLKRLQTRGIVIDFKLSIFFVAT